MEGREGTPYVPMMKGMHFHPRGLLLLLPPLSNTSGTAAPASASVPAPASAISPEVKQESPRKRRRSSWVVRVTIAPVSGESAGRQKERPEQSTQHRQPRRRLTSVPSRTRLPAGPARGSGCGAWGRYITWPSRHAGRVSRRAQGDGPPRVEPLVTCVARLVCVFEVANLTRGLDAE